MILRPWMIYRHCVMIERGALVDSSAWINYFRPDGDKSITEKVDGLLSAGRAGVCEMVMLELRRGKSSGQRKSLELLHEVAVHHAIDSEVWRIAYRVAEKLRSSGRPVPNTDILIYACALRYDLELVHNDRHFAIISAE